jgi:protein NEDD1
LLVFHISWGKIILCAGRAWCRFASTTGLPSSRFDSLAAPASGSVADSKQPSSAKGDMPLLRSLDQDSSLPLTNGVAHQPSMVPASDFEAATIAANRKLLSYEARDLNSSFSRSLPGSLPGSAGDAGPPKQRKSVLERREDRGGVPGSSDGKKDLENGYALRPDATASTGATPPASNVCILQRSCITMHATAVQNISF